MQTHRIPLFRRGQAEPIAFTIVDAADARWLLEHRWGLGSDGYATRRRPGVAIRMHREILGLAAGDGRHTDHINRDKLDNRRANLRVVTAAQNMQNRPSVPGSSSRYRGVYWEVPRGNRRGSWRARAHIGDRFVSLGRFAVEIEAAVAVEAFRREHMPFAEPDPALAADLAARMAA